MPDNANHSSSLHPMRSAMRRTGLSADALRAWEKRYQAVAPERSTGGQRLYSELDIERLALMHRLTEAGHAISQIAQLSADELRSLLAAEETATVPSAAPSEAEAAEATHLRHWAMRAAERLDGSELEAVLRRGVMRLGDHAVLEHVLAPFLRELGEKWHRGEITPAHEHLGSAVARRVLAWVQSNAQVARSAPVAVVATPEGQRHELGAEIVAAVAAGEGWRVVYLGADLPSSAIVAAAQQARARLVALSLIVPLEPEQMLRHVGLVRNGLPGDVGVVVGGAGAESVADQLGAIGVRVVPDLQGLRTFLRTYLSPAESVG